jgi:chemotaxis protein methyltransferase CheR
MQDHQHSNQVDVEELEIELLLEAVYRKYGYDFREYAHPSLGRRVRQLLEFEQIASVSQLQDRVLRDRATLDRLLERLAVGVTAMFRDPTFFAAFREEVVPVLRTYPFLRIWHAGCSTGEEVYSMCILLEEANLLSRARIYATDISASALAEARRGIFPLSRMQEYTRNYQAAGGVRAFSDYYATGYEHAVFDARLTQNVLFAQHDLAIDTSFSEFNVIVCKNVMIYFRRELKSRVFGLFVSSLSPFGVLCLGSRESLRCTEFESTFDVVSETERIYRRTY